MGDDLRQGQEAALRGEDRGDGARRSLGAGRGAAQGARRARSAQARRVRILGLETSCDDTSAAVVDNGRLRSNVVSSQTALHRPFRGVVPELASRAHLECLMPAVARALKEAGPGRVDAVAYTRGPGLLGPLLVGKVAAQTLARLMRVPAVGVNHLEGHVLAAELEHRL
ncbi:MAG: hypothetical protein HYZ74_07845, partial [Elusimicrobia bacterium]|nr:hypothetical protein [Elusimicrobiota bacterium]